jgi:hypothetical protein
MSKLLITTQVVENYGSAEEPYWKPKGGSDYVVKGIDVNSAREIVEALRPQVECNNEYCHEYILGWEVVSDDYLTEFEQSQLDYEGVIRFPARELSVPEAV